MDEVYEKIKQLNKSRLDYFDAQVKKLEDDSLEYLADANIASGNRHITDKIKLRNLKCEWLCGALPEYILFRLSVDDNSSSVDIDFLIDVMKDRGYNSIVLDYNDYGYVFERKIYLVDGDRKSKLIAQAEKLAEQYNYGSCFKEFHPDNSGKSIDISNEVTDAFIAGYLAMNERIINERLL